MVNRRSAPFGERAAPVAQVIRGDVVESVHHGHVVCLDAEGEVVLSVGDRDVTFLARSACKPLQAVGMLRAGLDLDGELLALAAASHSGQAAHLDGVRRILAAGGLTPADLRNTPDVPLDPDAAFEWRIRGGGPEPLAQNCSGKHAAMLLTCLANGWSTQDYLQPGSPLQVALREAVEELTGVACVHTVVDGCGAPAFSTTPSGLARAAARIATAAPGTPEGRVAAAMRTHPWWVSGSGRDALVLSGAIPGLLAKDGAEGVFVAAMPDGRTVVVKVLDGSKRPLRAIVAAGLRVLGADEPGLEEAGRIEVLGHGSPVGAVEPLIGSYGSGIPG
jgi:L-asparaginase II